jgi:monoamine oxidase
VAKPSAGNGVSASRRNEPTAKGEDMSNLGCCHTTLKPWDEVAEEDRLAIIESPQGLKGLCHSRKKGVAILGAGMAGLVAAYELFRAGHDVTVLEAQDKVGGRIRTLRDPFTHGLYADVGAMRIPRAHKLTMAYVRSAFDRSSEMLRTTRFEMACKKAFCRFRGQQVRWEEYEENPEVLKFEGLNEHEKRRPIFKLFESILAPLKEEVGEKDPSIARLNKLMRGFEKFSTRRYLEELHKWSYSAVDAFGLIEGQQARLNNGVTALLREYLLNSFSDLIQIEGGMDLLPRSFLPKLEPFIKLGAKVEKIEHSGSKEDPDGAYVYYSGPSGEMKPPLRKDFAVVTLPFPLLRHLDGLSSFSWEKQRAIQGLNYSEAGKIFLQCAARFWEVEEIFGGRTQTDLGLRSIWYPTTDPDKPRRDGRCVLLASYTWGRDAQRWAHLSAKERVRNAVKELAEIHPIVANSPDLIEGGMSVMWQNEEFAGGAFALTNPEQVSLHDDNCRKPEGRFHFAGEHTSLNYHRWIEGAVESGLRTAYEIHRAP